MIDNIKKVVHAAAGSNQKIAMFHLQVLKHAKELEDLNAKAFCKEIGVPQTYATEFTKMIGLAKLLAEHGVRLS